MSSSIDALNGQGISFQFDKFAQMAASATKGSNIVRFIGGVDADTVHEVFVTESDKVGKIFRSDSAKEANNVTRTIFRQSVAAMFGGESKIPESVRDAMKMGDYGKGKPLSARRIMAVKVAVDEAMRNFPIEPPKINVPKATVRQTGVPGDAQKPDELFSAQDLRQKGYTPAEMKKLNDVAEMFKEATGCSTADAQKAALDPKSDARRLFGYGGTFTASADNFKKGLALIGEFDAWYQEQGGKSYLTPKAKLSVEKFVFEEIACNPKLSLDTANPRDLFSEEKNLAIPFIKGNMMESISGSMAAISPEKRSVVYALADALNEKVPGGRTFKFNSAILSRTLAHLGKATELVYSGNLNRTTAFNALFSDFKSLGVDANTSNDDIDTVVGPYVMLTEEREAAFDPDDDSLFRAINQQGQQSGNMFNTSGASIQECRRAAMSGQTFPMAPGMTDITAGLEGADGFSDAGRSQFINDIHRPVLPLDPKTNAPVISEENNVFRFNIAGQAFTAKTCGFFERNNPQNNSIAQAVEKFCNKEIRPLQTNAVFFALSQGGLMPQLALKDHGYLAADHGPVSYTLSRNADNGDITIKYENPVGSPLKFSWTATVDVDGKVSATPIQIEK